jgi:hypothetical protein
VRHYNRDHANLALLMPQPWVLLSAPACCAFLPRRARKANRVTAVPAISFRAALETRAQLTHMLPPRRLAYRDFQRRMWFDGAPQLLAGHDLRVVTVAEIPMR